MLFGLSESLSNFFAKPRKIVASIMILMLLAPLFPSSMVQAQTAEKQAPSIKNARTVAVLVEDRLYDNALLKTRINRYVDDIQKSLEHQAVLVPIGASSSVLEIYEYLSKLYFAGVDNDGHSKLQGVILIGNLPLPVVEKGGNYWPTIFPYTDFENPVYRWDFEADRFVYDDGFFAHPEIWHGVIRAADKDIDTEFSQLKNWFDQNHKVHIGEEDFTNRVFYSDFSEQYDVVTFESFFRYQQWLKYAEPIQYLWFTKHFLKKLTEDKDAEGFSFGAFGELSETEKQELINEILESAPELTREEVVKTLDDDPFADIPDINTRGGIDGFVRRYSDLYEHWMTEIIDTVFETGRWKIDDIDSTPLLVSRKDEASILRMRFFNDELEDEIIQLLKDYSVPADVTITNTQTISFEYPFTDSHKDGVGHGQIRIDDLTHPHPGAACYTDIQVNPLFWNGVNRQTEPVYDLDGNDTGETRSFEVEDCTNIRGSQRSTSSPLAQRIEVNNIFDRLSGGQCLPHDVDMLARRDDIYEGTCATNLEEADDGTLGYEYGVRTSKWEISESLVARVMQMFCQSEFKLTQKMQDSGCFHALEPGEIFDCCYNCHKDPEENPDHHCPFKATPQCIEELVPDVIHHFGAEKTTQNLAGTEEWDGVNKAPTVAGYFSGIGTGTDGIDPSSRKLWYSAQGVEGCRPLVTTDTWGTGATTFNSLMIHDEPRPETIMAQYVNGTTKALPVDDPRGFSFWNHANTFHRIDFPNIFTYREIYDDADQVQFEADLRASLKNKIEEINVISQAGGGSAKSIPTSSIDDFLERINLAALFEAVQWVDKGIDEKNRVAFEKAMSDTSTYRDFFEDDIHDGYEVVQILGKGTHENGLELAFYPTKVDTDEDYIEAQERIANFQYKVDEQKFEFLGVDIREEFFNKDEESKCDSTPSTLLSWSSKASCSQAATTKATSKFVNFGPNLGTTKPLEPVIEDFNVNLEGKALRITPQEVLVHSQDPNPVEITVELVDQDGVIQKRDFTTEIALEFDSTDTDNFFTVTPAEQIPVTTGKAHFFLDPKQVSVGTKMQVKAKATHVNSPEVEIVSAPISINYSRFEAFAVTDKYQTVVKDEAGLRLEVKILDAEGNLTRGFDGKKLTLQTDGGTFTAGESEIEIIEGMASTQFFPGKKAGEYKIHISDPAKLIAGSSVDVELVPDVPESIHLSKKSKFLIADGVNTPVKAELRDRYGNQVFDVSHVWNWQWDNVAVKARQERDIDPRTQGIQEYSNPNGFSELLISSDDPSKRAYLQVGSDYFDDGRPRSINLQVIEDPVIKVELNKSLVFAGKPSKIKATVRAETQNGELINDDFDLNFSVAPVREGTFPEAVKLIDGVGTFEFTPGSLAGDYTLYLTLPGFVDGKVTYAVLPGDPAKIEMKRVGDLKFSAELDPEKPIEIEMQVMDDYKNRVIRFNDTISLKATELTNYLVDIRTSDLNLVNGQGIIEIYPKGISGTVRLIAEHEDLVPDSMEIEIVDFFRVADVPRLSAKSLMTLILGFEAGDLRHTKNFATEFLHRGKTQGVGTLVSNPTPYYQYGSIAPNGDLGNELRPQFVFGAMPEFLINSGFTKVAQAQMHFKSEPNFEVVNEVPKIPGVYFRLDSELLPDTLKFKSQVLTFDQEPLLRFTDAGGFLPISKNIKIKPSDDFNLYEWQVEYNGEPLGLLTFVSESRRLLTTDRFYADKDFAGLQIKAIDPDVFFDTVYTGNNTNGVQGIGIFDSLQKEEGERKLGSAEMSAENALGNNELIWRGDWKPAMIFAAHNHSGVATQWGGSDAFLFLGDPSIVVKGDNDRAGHGFEQDLGKTFWHSPEGDIQQIITSDINADGALDVLALVNTDLFALYQTDEKRDNFRDAGKILEFIDGVQTLIKLDANTDGAPKNHHLLQLNTQGYLTYWVNTYGVFAPKPVDIGVGKIESIQRARLNTDIYTDLIVADMDHNLWAVYGIEGEAFAPPIKIASLAPNFQESEEVFESGQGLLPGLNIRNTFFSYDGITEDETFNVLEASSFNSPFSKDITIDPAELDQYVLGAYYDPEAVPSSEVFFLPGEASGTFLSRITYEVEADFTQPKLGDVVDFTVTINPNTELKDFIFMPPKDNQLEYVPGSFSCDKCSGESRMSGGRGIGLFWAEVGTVPGNQEVRFTWKQELREFIPLGYFVGDFDDGEGDNIDDVVLPWKDGKRDKLLTFSSKKKIGSRTLDTLPYLPNGELIEVGRVASYADEVHNLDQADLDEAYQSMFGASSDTDGDGLPYDFDHYPEVNNEAIDKALYLSSSSAGAIISSAHNSPRNQFLATLNESFSINSANAALTGGPAAMLRNLASNPLAKFLQGHDVHNPQTESEAPGLPGLVNKRNRRDGDGVAEPKKKNGKFVKDPGNCVICLPNYRKYIAATTTGKSVIMDAFGSKIRHMAGPPKPKWDPNSFLRASKQAFLQNKIGKALDSKLSKFFPNNLQMAAAASKYKSGSNIFLKLSEGLAAANSIIGSAPRGHKGKIPAQRVGSSKFGDGQRAQHASFRKGIGQGNAGNASFKPSTDFGAKMAQSASQATGDMRLAMDRLGADLINTQYEPVPISIPAMSQEDMQNKKQEFDQNKQGLMQELEEKIPFAVNQVMETLTSSIEVLETLTTLKSAQLVLPEKAALTTGVQAYETQLRAFAEEVKTLCQGPKASENKEVCEKSLQLITRSVQRLDEMKTFIAVDYDTFATRWEGLVTDLEEVRPKIPKLVIALNEYAGSLEKALEARNSIQNHTAQHDQNFKALGQMVNQAAKQVLQMRDMENRIVAAATQVVQKMSNYSQGLKAEQSSRQAKWDAKSLLNKQILKAIQGVQNINFKYSDKCRVPQVHVGGLFPWLHGDTFNKGFNQEVMHMPKNPNTQYDGRLMTPGGNMDITLPTPQINRVDMGQINTMDAPPSVPNYSEDIVEAQTKIKIPQGLATDLKANIDAAQGWLSLREWENGDTFKFFPTLDVEGNIVTKATQNPLLGDMFTKLPKEASLKTLAELDIESLPEPVQELPLKIPKVKKLLKLPIPQLMQMPMPNIPFDQPNLSPPATQQNNIVGDLMGMIQKPLKWMNLECNIALNATSVPEGWGKAQGEKITDRRSLDRKRDFGNGQLKGFHAQAPKNLLSTFGKSKNKDGDGKRKTLFEGVLKKLRDQAQQHLKFFNQNASASLPITVADGGFIPESLREDRSWIERITASQPATSTPYRMVKDLKRLAAHMPAYSPEQKELRAVLANIRVPEPDYNLAYRKEVKETFDAYIAQLENYKKSRAQETRMLANIYKSNPENFFAHSTVQQILEQDKRYLASSGSGGLGNLKLPSAPDFKRSIHSFGKAGDLVKDLPSLKQLAGLEQLNKLAEITSALEKLGNLKDLKKLTQVADKIKGLGKLGDIAKIGEIGGMLQNLQSLGHIANLKQAAALIRNLPQLGDLKTAAQQELLKSLGNIVDETKLAEIADQVRSLGSLENVASLAKLGNLLTDLEGSGYISSPNQGGELLKNLGNLTTIINTTGVSQQPTEMQLVNAQNEDDAGYMIKSGLYYSQHKDDRPEFLFRMPIATPDIPLAIDDLDDDGINEVLWAMNDQIYVKRKTDPVGDELRFTLKTKTLEETLKKSFSPVSYYESFMFGESPRITFNHQDTDPPEYYEWYLTERPDTQFEIMVPKTQKVAQYQRVEALLLRAPSDLNVIRTPNALVKSVSGTPQIKSPLYTNIQKFPYDACLNEVAENTYINDATILSGDQDTEMFIFYYSGPNVEAETVIQVLPAGKEVRLEDVEICVFEGNPKMYEDDPGEFLSAQNVSVGIPVFDQSIISLKSASDKVIMDLFNGEKVALQGPIDYRFHVQQEINDDFDILLPETNYTQLYAILMALKEGVPTYFRNLFIPSRILENQ